ncbi:MAG: TIGR00730 family Rossman fold protein [Burkholderiaceae bacterium]
MKNDALIKQRALADAWDTLQNHAGEGKPLEPHAYRVAFADPEFLLRRETRGIRMQLEMLKPDLEQQARGIQQTIVVFGSARFCSPEDAQKRLETALQSGDAALAATAQKILKNSVYYTHAQRFATLVALHSQHLDTQDKLFICTGGGPGIMEAANRGAHDVGAPSVGLSIALPFESSGNAFITPELSFKFHYFALRKMHFMIRAKALVAFPGGFGTLDELFEVITLVQTGKSQPVPIILFGTDYWKRLVNFDVLVEEGAISERDLQLVHYVDEPEAAWEIIRAFYSLG